jgi:ferredoxin
VKIIIDWDKCIGAGMCTGIAPDLFELDGAGKLVVTDETPGEERRKAVEAAVACCPVEAISVET